MVLLQAASSQGFQLQNENGNLETAPTTAKTRRVKKKPDETKICPKAIINCSADLMEEIGHVLDGQDWF